MKRTEFLKMLSRIIKTAKAIYRSGRKMKWGDALRLAWWKAKFETDLKKCKVTFTFIKKDKTERKVSGTMHPSYLEGKIKGATQKANLLITRFVDTDLGQFRSFNILNQI